MQQEESPEPQIDVENQPEQSPDGAIFLPPPGSTEHSPSAHASASNQNQPPSASASRAQSSHASKAQL